MKNFPSDDPNEIQEKPHVCDICSTRYKTKAGLNYHYNHHHQGYRESKDKWGSSDVDFEGSSSFTSTPVKGRPSSHAHGNAWGNGDFHRTSVPARAAANLADAKNHAAMNLEPMGSLEGGSEGFGG
jgi:hypothetical protein